MKTFGKDVPDRWEKIAMAVPGKTRQECFSRFKELKEEHQAKKQAPAKAAEGEAGAGAGTGAAAGAAAGASGGPWTAEEEQVRSSVERVVLSTFGERVNRCQAGVMASLGQGRWSPHRQQPFA